MLFWISQHVFLGISRIQKWIINSLATKRNQTLNNLNYWYIPHNVLFGLSKYWIPQIHTHLAFTLCQEVFSKLFLKRLYFRTPFLICYFKFPWALLYKIHLGWTRSKSFLEDKQHLTAIRMWSKPVSYGHRLSVRSAGQRVGIFILGMLTYLADCPDSLSSFLKRLLQSTVKEI